jgi:predicted DNA-binding transcriptional regulator AlpA
MNISENSRLLSHKDAAKYLGVSQTTLTRHLNAKTWDIPAIHLGGESRPKFDIRDLDEFIQSKKIANN